MYNKKKLSGFIWSININGLYSGDELVVLVLEAIHRGLNDEKEALFPCNCDCVINNNLSIYLYMNDITDSEYFEYSLKTGFFPANIVKEYYYKLNNPEKITVRIDVEQACQS